jgi:NADH dehydrogenase
VRVAVRRPNEAGFVRPYGTPGQVEPVFCNVRDDASVRAALAGAEAAVTCVGTFDKAGANNFDAVHVAAAGRIARIAVIAGASRLVHVSAIGADPAAASLYAQSKGKGEQAVLAAFPSAVILRPSVMFGPEDGLFNRFAGMVRYGPVLPLFGGATRFQPVYVDDVAEAAARGATGEAAPGIYELGGPDVLTMREIVERTLAVTHRRRVLLPLPLWTARLLGGALDAASAVTLGLVSNRILTRDQARQLAEDNVVADGARGLAELGIRPTDLDAVLPSYLWRYRPSGQYDAIKDSARRLKS